MSHSTYHLSPSSFGRAWLIWTRSWKKRPTISAPTPGATFWRVTFPLILPGVISGALLAFTLSLDDFVITFFTSGVGTSTLPVFVYGLLKLTVTPEVNAISTIMMVLSTLLIGISLVLQGRSASRV